MKQKKVGVLVLCTAALGLPIISLSLLIQVYANPNEGYRYIEFCWETGQNEIIEHLDAIAKMLQSSLPF